MKDTRNPYLIDVLILAAIFYTGRLQAAETLPAAQPLKTEKVEYKAEEASDPFFTEQEIEKPVEEEVVEKKPLPQLTIQGLIWGGNFPQAIVNNKVLRVGDSIEDARIVDINRDGLVLYFEGQQYNLTSPGMLNSKVAQTKPEGGINEESH